MGDASDIAITGESGLTWAGWTVITPSGQVRLARRVRVVYQRLVFCIEHESLIDPERFREVILIIRDWSKPRWRP